MEDKPAKRARKTKGDGGEAPAKRAKDKPRGEERSKAEPKADERPQREERPQAPPRREPRHEPRHEHAEQDEGWNGPVPSFLSQGFGA